MLVLVDHVEGEIKKSTFELLTAARTLGEPSAVIVGGPGTATKLADGLREYGAEKVYVAETDSTEFLSPQVDVLAALVERLDPAAVLIASSADGKEVAGRLAVRTGSGWLNDVVALDAQGADALGVRRGVDGAGDGEHRAPGDHGAAGGGRGRRRGGRGHGGERRRPAVRAESRRSCPGSR